MDGRITISIILLIFFILIVILGFNERKKEKIKQEKLIKKLFGKKRKKPELTESYKDYFYYNKSDSFYIDDTTASDVDLDNVFASLNHTFSIVGEEYLYYMLRTPSFNDEIKRKNEAAISFFENDKNRSITLELQKLFFKLGKYKKIDLFNFIEKIKNNKSGSIGIHIFCYILYLLSIILLIYKTGVGIIFLIGSLAFGIITYFRKKSVLSEIIWPTFYISKLEKTAKDINSLISKNDFPDIVKELSKTLKDSCEKLDKATKGTGYVFISSDKSKNIISIFIDYINMVMHFDILLFYKIRKGLNSKENEIRNLISCLGNIEALIAIGSYRLSLDKYCIPDFSNTEMIIEQVYHPLMDKPVKNNVDLNTNMLITGSNASGKSTYLKAASLAVIMAETINTVCADNYHVTHFRPYTSMALSDSLSEGDSFFMAEIKSIKRVIDSIDKHKVNIILFIDEILKGTNTVERIAASSQITSYLNEKKVKCIFATHDTELPKLLDKIVNNVHFKEDIVDGDVCFTYHLEQGPSKSRNAIKLLAKLGYDNQLTENASWMAEHYEDTKEWTMK